MCVLLGVHTILISKLGDDYFGQNYLKHLEAIGINVRHVTVEKNCSSPIANITVADSGENSIVYFPGCLDRIAETDIKSAESMFKRAKVGLWPQQAWSTISVTAIYPVLHVVCVPALNAYVKCKIRIRAFSTRRKLT